MKKDHKSALDLCFGVHTGRTNFRREKEAKREHTREKILQPLSKPSK